MAKKGTTKTKKVVTDEMTATEVVENIINDATTVEVQELVEKVENIIPTEEIETLTENLPIEEVLPQLNEKMEELNEVKEEIEKQMKQMSKKLTNSQVTYMWNGVSLFE